MTARFRGLVIAGDASALASSGESAKARSKETKSSRTRSGWCREVGARTTSTRALAYREATGAGIYRYLLGRAFLAAEVGYKTTDQGILIGRGHTLANLVSRKLYGELAGVTLELDFGGLERRSDVVAGVGLNLGELALGLLPHAVAFHGGLFAGGFPQRLDLSAEVGQLGIHGRGAFLGVGADLLGVLDPFSDFARPGSEIGAGLFHNQIAERGGENGEVGPPEGERFAFG